MDDRLTPPEIAVGLAGHEVFGFFHHMFIQNPGLPVEDPACVSHSTFSPLVFLPCC